MAGLLGVSLNVCACSASFGQESESPRSLSGLSDSQVDEIEDRQPLDLSNEILLRLLYRVAKISPGNLDAFSKYTDKISIADVLANPRTFRFWVFDIMGDVVSVKKVSMNHLDADSGMQLIYAVDVKVASGETVKVLSRSIPRPWKSSGAEGERVRFRGFLFGTVNASSTATEQDNMFEQMGIFVANRIQWFPKDENETLAIGQSQVLLASRGVDIALFDQVKLQNTKSMSSLDSECFYQMISATGSLDAMDMPGDAIGFKDLLKNPREHFGDAVQFEGRVRRCVPVQVSDASVQQATGLTQYYELDMFLSLGDQKIVVQNTPETKLEYEDRFPITVCLNQLPGQMTPAEIQDKQLVVTGFFYRFWKYQSEFTDQAGGGAQQVSPLIIAVVPEVVSPDETVLDNFLMVCMVGLLLLIAGMLWFFRSNDSTGGRGHSKRKEELPEQLDLSQIESV